MGKKILFAMVFLMLGLAFINVSVVRAQSILNGKLSGTITDDKGESLPGVTVEVTSPALISGKRSTATSARGTYFFLNLPVGFYKITASIPSFKTTAQENIDISAGSSIVVDLTMVVGAIEETVTVTAAGPIVDSKSSSIDSKLEQQMINKLPTSRDAFYDLSLTTPGMFDHGASGLPSPTAYSSAANENVFLVNGVDATNPRGSAFGTLIRVNYNAVEEVRVVALGSKAEYGSYSGAAIDVLTKSGSNKFHGSAAFYVEPVKWRRSNQPQGGENLGRNWLFLDPEVDLYGLPPKKDYEGNLTLGGPIVKNKVWFFGGLNYLYHAGERPRWSLLGEDWGRYADLKISAEPLTGHRAWVSYHYEKNDSTGGSWGSEPEWDTSMTYGMATKNQTLSAQWQWLPTSNMVLTAKYLGFWTDEVPTVPADAPDHPGYINWGKWAQYGVGGAFPYIEGWRSNRQTVQADVSYYAEDFLGEHDIKFGVQWTRGRSNSLGGYFQNYVNFLYPLRSYAGQYVDYAQTYYGDTGLLFYNYQDHINPFMTVGTTDSLGFFLDDQWTPTKRLTINLGLRYDRMTSRYGKGFEYEPLTKPTDIANPTVRRVRADSPNIFDFRTWSPRIGLTYTLTKDAKTVVRASYGRYYQPLSVENLRRYGPDCPFVTRHYQIYEVPWDIADANGDNFIDASDLRGAARWVSEHRTPVSDEIWEPEDYYSWELNVQSGLKDQFTDQLSLSLEREIIKDFSVSGAFIYKHSANIYVDIPVMKGTGEEYDYLRIPFTLDGGRQVELYSIPKEDYNGDDIINQDDIWYLYNKLDNFKVVNMPSYDGKKPKRDYMGLQLVFNKRFSNRWQGLASLLYSHTNGVANRIMAQGINVEGPMMWDNNWMGSLNYALNNMEGPLPFTPKFEFKVSGSYTIPYAELDLGFRFRMHTGRPVWKVQEYPFLSAWGGSWEDGIVTFGMPWIVADDPKKPDYMPTQKILDLRLERAFTLSKYGAIHVILDVLNVFNAKTANDVSYMDYEYGRIGSLVAPRRFRFTLMYDF
jgi:hypothetical protein